MNKGARCAFDVGTVTLSCCVASSSLNQIYFWQEFNIYKFDITNPTACYATEAQVTYQCSGWTQKGTICKLKCKYYLDCPLGIFYYCEKDKLLSQNIWNEGMIDSYWTKMTKELGAICMSEGCNQNAIWIFNNTNCHCSKHKSSIRKKQSNAFKLKNVKTLDLQKNAYSYSLMEVHKYMFQVLQYLQNIFDYYQVEIIGIENQPHELNPQMKTCGNFIYDFFFIRMMDGSMQFLRDITMINANCKLKLDGKTIPTEIAGLADNVEKYQKTKKIGFEFVILLLYVTQYFTRLLKPNRVITPQTIASIKTDPLALYQIDYSQCQLGWLMQHYPSQNIYLTHNMTDAYLLLRYLCFYGAAS